MSAEKKRSGSDGDRSTKRQKGTDATDPSQNPYLAHMYSDNQSNGGSILNTFTRYQTTVADATKAEDGPENPFNGRQLSKNYFKILETRRNLPVHQQRYVFLIFRHKKRFLRRFSLLTDSALSSLSFSSLRKSSFLSVKPVPERLLRSRNLFSSMISHT